MPQSSRDSIYQAIASIRLIDPHTHINPHHPASDTLADLLGYHYYTELAHSAGMPKDQIEGDAIGPRELVGRLVANLEPLENTAQYRWLIEICRMFFGFDGDRIDVSNWETLYDQSEKIMASAQWPQMVLDKSNVESVFLTNDFDDDLQGFDADTYIPCLRTDDLVFHLAKSSVRDRLAGCTQIPMDGSLGSLRDALQHRFEHFVSRGARACAISIPPTFCPTPVSDGRAATALAEICSKGELADPAHRDALSRRVFWTLAELCDHYSLPFDLMIGVNRGVYADGVYQGQDLYDSRVSLLQYRELFNAFPSVTFPISVLASVTNQELVSYAWIFPNVVTNGHWWYSNTPSFIHRDAQARLEAVPKTKQIGYYSDAYKLEFVWPKFDMYRRELADILDSHFVGKCGWSEERAIELGRQVLRDNVDSIFPRRAVPGQAESVRAEPGSGTVGSPEAGIVAAETIAVHSREDADPGQIETVVESLDDGVTTEMDRATLSLDDEPESSPENPFDSSEGLADMTTVTDISSKNVETVNVSLENEEGDDESDHDFDVTETAAADADVLEINEELDPIPSESEVASLDVADVQLGGPAEQDAFLDDTFDDAIDPEPLSVGDLLADAPPPAIEDTDSGEGEYDFSGGQLDDTLDEDIPLIGDELASSLEKADAMPLEPESPPPSSTSEDRVDFEDFSDEDVDRNF